MYASTLLHCLKPYAINETFKDVPTNPLGTSYSTHTLKTNIHVKIVFKRYIINALSDTLSGIFADVFPSFHDRFKPLWDLFCHII